MANFFDQFDTAPTPKASPFADAISGIESGGNYKAIGPVTKNGDRAFGKYQVMGANIAPWTTEVLGRPLTRQEWLSSPELQDKVFEAKFGKYVEKYGPEGAAKAWFAGERGMNNPNAKDVLGTTVQGYGQKFSRALGPTDVSAQSKPAGGNFFDQFDGAAKDAPATDAPTKITVNPIADRFVQPEAPANAPAMQQGLERTARDMTTGPATSPVQRMAIEHGNTLAAASQGATPNVDILSKNLISTEVFEGDDGSIQFRDPQSGQVMPTDNTKHVVMRDPADNTPKVYAKSAETEESPIVGRARVLAPGMLAGAPTARAALPAAGHIQPKASDIMATAKPSYRAFEQQARATPVPANISDRIRGALDDVGLSEEMAGAPIRAALTYLDSGKMTSLNDLQKVKKIIGHGFANSEKSVRDAAAVASRTLMESITDVAPSAAQNLKHGDAVHSTAMAVQDLQRKGAVADLRKGRAGYGGNAVNSMRQVLSPIVQRAVEGRKTSFKPDEIAAMREIVEGTTATNALRSVGQLSPSKGIIQTVGAGGAMYAAGPAALAIPAIGAASNKLAAYLTSKQIDRLKELVAKRSPEYAKAVQKAVERYERAQMELVNNPTPNKFAAYLSASRALSSGLTRDGIEVTSGALLKAIQGPVKSAAEEE